MMRGLIVAAVMAIAGCVTDPYETVDWGTGDAFLAHCIDGSLSCYWVDLPESGRCLRCVCPTGGRMAQSLECDPAKLPRADFR